MYKTKIDPHTKEEFTPKRHNQKFATKENQIAFNNEIALTKRTQFKEVNDAIKNNYNILEKLLFGATSRVVNTEFMDGTGYDLNYFTGLSREDDKPVIQVYEYKVCVNKDNTVELWR